MITINRFYEFSYFKVLIVGFFIGIWTAFIMWGAYLYYLPPAAVSTPLVPQPILGTTRAPVAHTLALSTPEDETLLYSDAVEVLGNTSPQAVVAVINGTFHRIKQADATGSFSITVDLTEGINTLYISAIDGEGSEQSATRVVIFSKEREESL